MNTNYMRIISTIKDFLAALITRLERSMSARIAYLIFSVLFCAITFYGTWSYWKSKIGEQILANYQIFENHRVVAISETAIEELALCEKSKLEGSALADSYCRDAESIASRAIIDTYNKLKIKEYLRSGGYPMAAILIKYNLKQKRLDLEQKSNSDYEVNFVKFIEWLPLAPLLISIFIISPLLLAYFRASTRKIESWQDSI